MSNPAQGNQAEKELATSSYGAEGGVCVQKTDGEQLRNRCKEERQADGITERKGQSNFLKVRLEEKGHGKGESGCTGPAA